jgi:hypothetical protein
MNLFSKATGKLFVKQDLDIVIDFLKSAFKSELDIARIKQNKGIIVDLGSDWMLQETAVLINSVIRNIDMIRKRVVRARKDARDAKGSSGVLSADEKFSISMASIQDVKHQGLTRALTVDERNKIKEATRRFNTVYSEQIKNSKSKERRTKTTHAGFKQR